MSKIFDKQITRQLIETEKYSRLNNWQITNPMTTITPPTTAFAKFYKSRKKFNEERKKNPKPREKSNWPEAYFRSWTMEKSEKNINPRHYFGLNRR